LIEKKSSFSFLFLVSSFALLVRPPPPDNMHHSAFLSNVLFPFLTKQALYT